MSARKTENYQLNQWEASDQVLREDFNRDNTLLDSALALLAEQVSTKAETSALNALSTRVNKKADMETLTAVLQKLNLKADSSSVTSLSQTVSSLSQTVSQKAESSRVEAVAASVPKILCGSYTGNGSESRFIPSASPPRPSWWWGRTARPTTMRATPTTTAAWPSQAGPRRHGTASLSCPWNTMASPSITKAAAATGSATPTPTPAAGSTTISPSADPRPSGGRISNPRTLDIQRSRGSGESALVFLQSIIPIDKSG